MKHLIIKMALAVVASAVTLFAITPAHADTSWARGGNWSSAGGLVNDIIAYPDGISSTTTVAQAQGVADTIANDYLNAGINFVRFPVNPATVAGNWSVTQACINELVVDGLYVDICCWYVDPEPQGGDGLIHDMNIWKAMWQTIDEVYKSNNMVYYEPINEPSGYTLSGLENVYTTFLNSYGIQKSQNHIILDGTGYADDVTGIGGNSSLSSCLLAVHDYPFWNSSLTTESQWKNQLQSEVGGYANRTILTEFGAPTTTGKNYDVSANDNEISFIRGIGAQCHAWPMGSVYFPTHQPSANNKRLFNNTPGTGVINQTMVDQLQNAWSLYTREDVFVQQSDGYLYQKSWTAGQDWSSWSSMGLQTIGGVAACSLGPNDLQLFARDTNSNLVQRVWTRGVGWSSWYNLGGVCTTDPAAVCRDSSHVDVFVAGTDGAIRVKSWVAGSGWNPNWVNIGGAVLVGTSPGACSLNVNNLQVFVTGITSNLYQCTWNGSWGGWLNLGGGLKSGPSAVVLDSGTEEVFATAAAGACYQLKWVSGQGWGTWINLGGVISGGPGACARGKGVVDIYARSTSNVLYQNQWFNTGMWSGWFQVDGTALTSDPDVIAWTY